MEGHGVTNTPHVCHDVICCKRCICLVVEAVLYESYLCPSERTCAMVRCIPDVFFLSMYSLLILFWAQVRKGQGLGGWVISFFGSWVTQPINHRPY